MAKRKPLEDRIQIRAAPAWIQRVQQHADKLGLSLSAYVRMVINRDMQGAGSDRPARHKKDSGGG